MDSVHPAVPSQLNPDKPISNCETNIWHALFLNTVEVSHLIISFVVIVFNSECKQSLSQ